MGRDRAKKSSEEKPAAADEARREFIIKAASGVVGTTLLLSGEGRAAAAQHPKTLFYTKEHVWAYVNGRVATVGVSNYVQSSLGKIGCVNLSPTHQKVGKTFRAGEKFGSVASVDIFDLKVPLTGRLIEVNEKLTFSPELVNADAYGRGWMIKVKLAGGAATAGLMSVRAYEEWVRGKPPLATYRNRVPPSDRQLRYVVTDACVDCKYTCCAAVCPTDAFHEMPGRVLINQATCIACDACVPECPVEAIFSADLVPEEYEKSVAINFEAENYPVICHRKPALRGPKCSGPPATPDACRRTALINITARTI